MKGKVLFYYSYQLILTNPLNWYKQINNRQLRKNLNSDHRTDDRSVRIESKLPGDKEIGVEYTEASTEQKDLIAQIGQKGGASTGPLAT